MQGTVVSFVAPHTLAARPLVVSPNDLIHIEHLGRGAALQVCADGVVVGRLKAGESAVIRRGGVRATLALVDHNSFYARYKQNFAVQMQFSGPRVRKATSGGVQ